MIWERLFINRFYVIYYLCHCYVGLSHACMHAARFNSQYSLFVSISQLFVCFSSKCQTPYNKLFINLACSVCTGNYRTSAFSYWPRPAGSICTKNTSVRYFSVQTSRSVNKKLLLRLFQKQFGFRVSDFRCPRGGDFADNFLPHCGAFSHVEAHPKTGRRSPNIHYITVIYYNIFILIPLNASSEQI